MRTRNGGTPKPAPPAKKTPPTRKSAAKNQTPPPAPTVESPAETTKRTSSSRGKQPKTDESTPTPAPNTPAVLETPDAKVSTGGKTTKTVARRAPVRKTPASRGGKRGQKVAEPEVSKIGDEELTEQQKNVEFSQHPESIEKLDEKEEAGELKDATVLEVVETAKFSPEMKIGDDQTEECQKNDIEEEKIGDVRIEECPNDVESVEKLSKEDMVVPRVTESLETAETVERPLEEESPRVEVSPNKGKTSAVNVHESIQEEEVVAENVHESIQEEEVVTENVHESIQEEEVVAENVHESIEVEEVVAENFHESIEEEEVVAENVHESIEVEIVVEKVVENVHEYIEVAENVHETIEEEKVVTENIEGEEVVTENVHESIEEEEDVGENVHESVEEEEVVEIIHESIEEKEVVTENVHESTKEEEVVTENFHESIEKEKVVAENIHESIEETESFAEIVKKNEDTAIGNLELAEGGHHDAMDIDLSGNDQVMAERCEDLTGEQKSAVETDPLNSSKDEEPDSHMQELEEKEKLEEEPTGENKIFIENEAISMVEDSTEMVGDYVEDLANSCPGDDMLGKNQEVLDAKNADKLVGDDLADHAEEAEECMQLTAVAEERKIRKELEIFVGGLDCEAHEDDVKKVFEQIGEVVDVRLHKDASTDKSKGYAFVRFATKEQASRALSELKSPFICGKECETAPCKDNDTLFLGNICNTWTKEAINLKMKEYGIESVLNIALVSDPRREGLSRGFAFLEFPCHADATLAFKRLQKPDVVFGHAERTAKVAFAEPVREHDPELLTKVKSVFLDGVPPDWDEEKVREHFKSYGEVIRIALSKNTSTAKRKDFGFVDYSSHEAAVACVDDINNKDFGDMKTKLKVSLSNPMPRNQAVKGGMCGGFKIDRPGTGSSSKPAGRGSGRGGYASNRSSFQRGRGFNPRGRGQFGRTGFTAQQHVQRPPFHGRQMFGRGGGSRAPSHISGGGGAVRPNPSFEGMTHNANNRGRGHTLDRRPPFPSEGGYPTPYRRPFEEPRFYDDNAHGMKRPHFMTEPDYIEPNRVRPRFDYSAPSVVPFQGSHQRDTFGASGSRSSQDYYNHSNYGQGAYRPPFGEYRPPYGGAVRPPFGGEVRPPYGGEVRPPYGGEVRPQRGDFRPPYNANARPPFGEGGRPYGGSNYYY